MPPEHKSKTLFDRRYLLKAGAIGTLAFTLNGCDAALTPRQAKTLGADMRSLSADQMITVERLGEVLLPGARDAGVAHFIDAQISNAPDDALSILRYMDWPPPYKEFYASGLDALNAFAMTVHKNVFAELDNTTAASLISEISRGQPETWNANAPPAPLFYFVTRNDAIDVVYGTMEGFEKLDVAYFPHIEPAKKW